MTSIFLQPVDGGPVVYEAGQFLTLLLSFRDRELRRSYSFATTPGVDPVAAICVKRVPNGEISRHLLDHLRVGETLTTLAPAGRFTLEAEDGDVVVLVAAGSGVVPVYSLLKQVLAQRPRVSVRLLTQQHDIAASAFRDAIAALAGSFGPRRLGWTEMLTVRDGRVHRAWLEDWVLKAGLRGVSARYYLCGPPDFMRMAQFTLRALGVPDDRIKREHFTVGHVPPAPKVFDATPKKVRVDLAAATGEAAAGAGEEIAGRKVDTIEFSAVWPDSILAAALRQGIPLPYSCRAGRCSSCVARCLRGRVRMTNNEVLTEKDLRDGLVLTCTGYAETDVELSYSRSSAANAIGSSEPERGIT